MTDDITSIVKIPPPNLHNLHDGNLKAPKFPLHLSFGINQSKFSQESNPAPIYFIVKKINK